MGTRSSGEAGKGSRRALFYFCLDAGSVYIIPSRVWHQRKSKAAKQIVGGVVGQPTERELRDLERLSESLWQYNIAFLEDDDGEFTACKVHDGDICVHEPVSPRKLQGVLLELGLEMHEGFARHMRRLNGE